MTQTLVEKIDKLLLQENPDAPLFVYHETIKQWRDEVANMSPGSGSSSVLLAHKQLLHADILALPTTAIEVVADPGPTKMIWPLDAILVSVFSAGYGNIDENAVIKLAHDANSGSMLSYFYEGVTSAEAFSATVSSLLVNWGTPNIAMLIPQQVIDAVIGQTFPQNGLTDTSQTTGALLLAAGNGLLGDFEDGDSADTLDVYVRYSVIDLPAP